MSIFHYHQNQFQILRFRFRVGMNVFLLLALFIQYAAQATTTSLENSNITLSLLQNVSHHNIAVEEFQSPPILQISHGSGIGQNDTLNLNFTSYFINVELISPPSSSENASLYHHPNNSISTQSSSGKIIEYPIHNNLNETSQNITLNNLSVDKANTNYQLRYTIIILHNNNNSITILSNISILSNQFSVEIGKPHTLQIIQHPTTPVEGGVVFPVQPRIAIVDKGGNVISLEESKIKASIYSNPTENHTAILSCGFVTEGYEDCIVSPTDGIVQFTSLSIDLAGTGYQLKFTLLKKTTSPPIEILGPYFDVCVGKPFSLQILSSPHQKRVLANNRPFPIQPQIALLDRGGNILREDHTTTINANIVASLSVGTSEKLIVDTSQDPIPEIINTIIYNDEYVEGDVISIKVYFSQNVIVSCSDKNESLFGLENDIITKQNRSSLFLPYIQIQNIINTSNNNTSKAYLTFNHDGEYYGDFFHYASRILTFEYRVKDSDFYMMENNSSLKFYSNECYFEDALGRNISNTFANFSQKVSHNTTQFSINNQIAQITNITLLDTSPSLPEYGVGQIFDFLLTFSRRVSVIFGDEPTPFPKSIPEFPVNSGGKAKYYKGSGTSQLLFRYIIQDGESTAQLNISQNSLNFPSTCNIFVTRQDHTPSTIRINSTIPSVLDIHQKNISVNTNAPRIISVLPHNDTNDGTYYAGDVIFLKVVFDKPVSIEKDSAILYLNMKDPLIGNNRQEPHNHVYAKYSHYFDSSQNTLVFKYTIQKDHTTNHLNYYHGPKALVARPDNLEWNVDGNYNHLGSIRRLASEPTQYAILQLPEKNSGKTLADVSNIKVDGNAPKIVNITFYSSTNNASMASVGDSILFQVEFTHDVVVQIGDSTLLPRLNLFIGDSKERDAIYIDGNQTNILIFEYIILIGDECDCGENDNTTSLESSSCFRYRYNTFQNDDGFSQKTKEVLCLNSDCSSISPESLSHQYYFGYFFEEVHIYQKSSNPVLQVNTNYVGNITPANISSAICIDTNNTSNTTVVSINTHHSNGIYGVGEVILIDVTFSDIVEHDSSLPNTLPKINLNVWNNGQNVKAPLLITDAGGKKSKIITFQYTISENDVILPGESFLDWKLIENENFTSAIDCSPFSYCHIVNENGRNVDLTFTGTGVNLLNTTSTKIKIDTSIPQITTIYTNTSYPSFPSRNHFHTGDEIIIYVRFDQPIVVMGDDSSQQLRLMLDFDEISYAHHNTQFSTTETDLAFLYVVQQGHSGNLTLACCSIITSDKTKILRKSTNPTQEANLTLPSTKIVSSNEGDPPVVVDTSHIPYIQNVTLFSSDTSHHEFSPGDILSINVQFNEPVYVFGSPELYLDVGNSRDRKDGIATFVSGNSTSLIMFEYIIKPEHKTRNLGYIDIFSLPQREREGGSSDFGYILQKSPNPSVFANTTLPEIGTNESLSQKIVIDNRIPYITKFSTSLQDTPRILKTGDVVYIYVHFNVDVAIIVNETDDGVNYGEPLPYLVLAVPKGNYVSNKGEETNPNTLLKEQYRVATFTGNFSSEENLLEFAYEVQLGDLSNNLDYYTTELDFGMHRMAQNTSIFVFPGKYIIRRKSQNPVLDAHIHLNPSKAFLGGITDKNVSQGIVKFEDLRIGLRGLDYEVRYQATIEDKEGCGAEIMEISEKLNVYESIDYEVTGVGNTDFSSSEKKPFRGFPVDESENPDTIRDEGDLFGKSVGIDSSSNFIAIGAPHKQNHIPQVQILSVFSEEPFEENEIKHEVQVIKTSLKDKQESMKLVQSFSTCCSTNATNSSQKLSGYFTLLYYDHISQNYIHPLEVTTNFSASQVQSLLEVQYPIIHKGVSEKDGHVKVSRENNINCDHKCGNAYTWKVTFLDLSPSLGNSSLLKTKYNNQTLLGGTVSNIKTDKPISTIRSNFTLRNPYTNQTSREIPHDVSSSRIKEIIESDLSVKVKSVYAVNTDSYRNIPELGRSWYITFLNHMTQESTLDVNVPNLEASMINTSNASSFSEVWTHVLLEGQQPLSGNFALSFRDESYTSLIPHDASPKEIKDALESLESIIQVTISSRERIEGEFLNNGNNRSSSTLSHEKSYGYRWRVTFDKIRKKTEYGWLYDLRHESTGGSGGNLPLLGFKDELIGTNPNHEVIHDNSGSVGYQSGSVMIYERQEEIYTGISRKSSESLVSPGEQWKLESKIRPSNFNSYDNFGYSLGIHMPFLVVGAPTKEVLGKNVGKVYLFERVNLNYNTSNFNCTPSSESVLSTDICEYVWNEMQILTPPPLLDDDGDSLSADEFGSSVAISSISDTMVIAIGSPGYKQNSGRVHVYTLQQNGSWTHLDTLTSEVWAYNNSTQGERFGSIVVINKSGNTIMVGAPGSHKVYVFSYGNSGKNYLASQMLEGFGEFGFSIGMDSDTEAVICAPGSYGESGACFVYTRQNSHALFKQQQKLEASNLKVRDRFGVSVDIDGDRIIVGQLEGSGEEDASSHYFGSSVQTIRTYITTEEEPTCDSITADQSTCTSTVTPMIDGHFYLKWRDNSLMTQSIPHNISALALRDIIQSELQTDEIIATRSEESDLNAGYIWTITFKNTPREKTESMIPLFQCSFVKNRNNRNSPDTNCDVSYAYTAKGGKESQRGSSASYPKRGKAHIFLRDPLTKTWIEQSFLFPSSKSHRNSQKFGSSVSIHGDTAIVGASNGVSLDINSGSAYIFNIDFLSFGFDSQETDVYEGGSVSLIFSKRLGTENDNNEKVTKAGQILLVKSSDQRRNNTDYNDGILDQIFVNTAHGSSEGTSQWVDGVFDYSAKSDYELVNQELYVDSWETEVSVEFHTTNDHVYENPNENVTLSLSLEGMFASVLGNLTTSLKIVDDGDGLDFDLDPQKKIRVHYEKLFGSDVREDHHFGGDIDLVEDLMVVGSEWANHGSISKVGKAYIFTKDSLGMWSQTAILLPSSPEKDSFFGQSVAICKPYHRDDVTVLLGAPGQTKAYVFVYSENNHTWVEEAVLISGEHDFQHEGKFAKKGAIGLMVGGDLAFVGSPAMESVYVYRRIIRPQKREWRHWTTLKSSEYDHDLYDNGFSTKHLHRQDFGVALDGDSENRLLIIGAPHADYGNRGKISAIEKYNTDGVHNKGLGKGKVFVFHSQPTTQLVTLFADDVPLQGTFRFILENYKDTPLAISEELNHNATTEEVKNVLERMENIGEVLVEKVTQLYGLNLEGYKYILQWKIILIGEIEDDMNTLQAQWFSQGSCDICAPFEFDTYMYHAIHDVLPREPIITISSLTQNTDFLEVDKIQAQDVTPSDFFGSSISINGNLIVVGSPQSSCKTRTTWDFESGDLTGWTKSQGNAFEDQPTFGDNTRFRSEYDGYGGIHSETKGPLQSSLMRGRYFIGTYEHRPGSRKDYLYPDPNHDPGNFDGDNSKGTLTSDPFLILGSEITFLIGGGCNYLTEFVVLIIDGFVTNIRSTGKCSERMHTVKWNVIEFFGRTGQIRIVDASSSSGKWGHINVDHFEFSWLMGDDKHGSLAPYFHSSNNIGGGGILPSEMNKKQLYTGREETPNAGAAYIFKRTCIAHLNNLTSTCSWKEEIRLTASDKRSGDLLGQSVSVNEEYGIVIAGSIRTHSLNINTFSSSYLDSSIQAGAIYIYLRTPTKYASDGNTTIEKKEGWYSSVEHAKISIPDGKEGDLFGSSISSFSSEIGVGAIGVDVLEKKGGAAFFMDLSWTRVGFSHYEYVALEGTDHSVLIELERDEHFLEKEAKIGYSTSDISAHGVNNDKFTSCLEEIEKSSRSGAGCGNYEQTSGELTFAEGERFAYFIVNIMDDLSFPSSSEKRRKFVQLNLHVPGGPRIDGEKYRALLRIDDDDWEERSSEGVR